MKNKLQFPIHNSLKCLLIFVFFFVAMNKLSFSQEENDVILEYAKTKTEPENPNKATVEKLNAEDVLSRRIVEQLGYGGFVITDQNTKISIGGLIIGNLYQDYKNMNSENYFAVSEIPMDAVSIFRTRADVGNSRFFINAEVNTKELDYRTRFEFDFYSPTGNYVFRLRHAFVDFGRFGVGYTSSNFGNIDIEADIADNGGAPSVPGKKQTQVRYIQPLSASSRMVFAVEEGTGKLLRDSLISETSRISPDFVVNFRYKPKYSSNSQLHIAAVLHPLGYKEKTNPLAGRFGWSANIGASIGLSEKNYFNSSVIYSDGATKYISDPVIPYDAIITTNSDSTLTITTIKMFGGYAYYHHRWTENYASNVGYSYVGGQKNQFISTSQEIAGHYASANIIYYPNNKMSFALEPIFGLRKNINNETAFNVRIQLQAKFSF